MHWIGLPSIPIPNIKKIEYKQFIKQLNLQCKPPCGYQENEQQKYIYPTKIPAVIAVVSVSQIDN